MASTYAGDVRALTETLAKALVDAPDQVTVEASEHGDTVEVSLRVASSDLGRVIGRAGRTARCLRAILNAAGSKAYKRYSLDIVE
ncbi:MAG TPA: KH domain-containing protein [Clostridia bacterium]|nr:KH domain-containing protein [Clostridia bacterium]